MSGLWQEAISDENTRLYAENQDLKRKLRMVKASPDEVWYWQPEGNDAASLTCPVVMEAATFRKYERAFEATQKQAAPPPKDYGRITCALCYGTGYNAGGGPQCHACGGRGFR